MKSELKSVGVTFEELARRLASYIRSRINNGEFTERSLARVLLISQPHLHNVLKGVRRVNVQFADRVMSKFKISILDLVTNQEMFDALEASNPDWLTAAATRKPPASTGKRGSEEQADLRSPLSGSK